MTLPLFGAAAIRGVRLGDALAVLRSLPDASFDACVTDPAYESLERHRATGTTTRLKQSDASSNAWFATVTNQHLGAIVGEVYRVLKPGSYAMILCDDPTDEVLRPYARDAGFWVWPSWTWVKVKGAGAPAYGSTYMADDPDVEASQVRIGMGYHGRRSTERIMMLEKRTSPQVPQAQYTVHTKPKGTGRQLNYRGWPDVLFHPRVDGGYPTEKPRALISQILQQVTSKGEVVLDPFCGSGVVGVAARELGREFLLSDLSPDAVQLATERTSTA